MSHLDYSKWDHIEVSDDEDDTHPNIDTPSLFRWRHRARLERDEEFKKEKDELDKKLKDHLDKLQNLKDKIRDLKNKNEDTTALEKSLLKLEEEEKQLNEHRNDFVKREKKRPWNIDTICQEGKSKTVINKVVKSPEPENEADIIDRMKSFVEKYDKEIKKFGIFRRPEDAEKFLKEHPHLVCEDTANHLVIWCIDLAVEEKNDLMHHVSRQCIVMQFILELAKSLKKDPRDCIHPFFVKFKNPEPEYQSAFDAELESFRIRIKERAEIRIQEAMARYEEEERQKRMGPGGLDPVEVFESLPQEMKDCFEQKNIDLLQDVLTKMNPADAEYHMKRCVASGMWVPDANKDKTALSNDDDQDGETEEDPVYDNDGLSAEKLNINDDANKVACNPTESQENVAGDKPN